MSETESRPPGDPVIEANALTKRFSTSVLAVDALSFVVERGQVCGMLGPNGAGKTTTLRMLVGLVHATSGDARLLGEAVRPGLPALARVGTLIEGAAFVPQLRGSTNLRVWWESGGARWDDAAVDDALAIAGLGDAVHRKVKTYSHGMKQRLGIARALLGRPEVLVLDEPTTGLDPQEIREVRRLVRRLSDQGATVLLSSHLLAEVEQTCTHLVVMDRGHLVAAGPTRDLVGAADTSVYLEIDDRDLAERVLAGLPGLGSVQREVDGLTVELGVVSRPALVAALVHGGVGVQTVTARRRLEDAFLGLVGEEHAVIAFLRSEWAKTVRRPRTYMALGFVMIIPVIVAVALWANPPDPGEGARFFAAASRSGLLFPAAMLRIMSRLVLVVVIGLFAGDAIAGEAGTGNLRYMLVRPLGRGRVVAGKLIVTLVLTLLATVVLTATALLAGGIAFGFEPIHAQIFFADQSVGNLLLHTGMATAYVAWTLVVVAAFGFMVSTMSDSAAAAAGAAVGLGVTAQILNEIESLGSIRDYLPFRYFDAWDGLFWSNHVPDDMYSGLLLPVPWIMAFLAIAWWWFRRKDVLS